MSFLSNARDKAIEMFVQRLDIIKRFGEILNIDIESEENRINITMLLKGETTPTKICAYYCFEDTDQSTLIVINKIESERVLINEIAALWLKGAPFKQALPKGTGLFAKMMF